MTSTISQHDHEDIDSAPTRQKTDAVMSDEEQRYLDAVTHLVREGTGFDLSLYRQNTLARTLSRRLAKIGCADYQAYAHFLTEHPTEAYELIEQVTIKVGRFFRNATLWQHLRETVVPEILRKTGGTRPAHVWSAGCGNGEEPYSMAILFAEALAEDPTGRPAVEILATDISRDALASTQLGHYPEQAMEETPPTLVAKYFTLRPARLGPQFTVADCLREPIRFLRHDLLAADACVASAPFDLILCRNVLIYFQRQAQERVTSLLTASLAPLGYLCLGEAEQLPRSLEPSFEVVDRAARLYRKSPITPAGR